MSNKEPFLGIQIPDPHSIKQKLIMEAFRYPKLKEIWIACGTKFGKTLGASGAQTSAAWSRKNILCRWVAPIYPQAVIGFKYAQNLFPSPPAIEVNKSGPSIYIPNNGSRIEYKSGKFPEDLEGEACHTYVLDECSKMSEQVYSSAWTTTTVTRGQIMAISTPRGKNWFYTRSMQAKEEMEWCRKNDLPFTKIFLTAATIDNPFVSKEVVEQARLTLPDRLFKQYYLAEFVDDGSVFVGYRQCIYTDFEIKDEYWIDQTEDHNVVIGADWAKTEDRCVFIAIDCQTRRVCGFWRFYKIPYTEAVRRLYTFSHKFKSTEIIFHDKTGLGNVIDDLLADSEMNFRGITFSNANKSDMVAKLMTAFEQKSIGIPNWEEMISELDAYEVATNALGSTTYSAPTGKHDDIVSALFLANAALLQYGDELPQFSFTLPQSEGGQEPADPMEDFYRELGLDNDDF